jgi:predicted ABC-type ATPase
MRYAFIIFLILTVISMALLWEREEKEIGQGRYEVNEGIIERSYIVKIDNLELVIKAFNEETRVKEKHFITVGYQGRVIEISAEEFEEFVKSHK